MIKVAIFGGSFDPPHKGHQYIVKRALKILDIDRLVVVPAFLNPFKKSTLASPSQRLKWCHRLFDSVDNIEIDDYEIRAGHAVYTSDSLRHLGKKYDIEYIIIGADNLSSITKWNEFEWIDSRFTWVVAQRVDYHTDRDMLRNSIVLEVDMPISSTKIRKDAELDMVDSRIRDEVRKLLITKGNNMTIDERADRIVAVLDSKKAEEIEVFDLDKVNYIAKRVIIANSLGGKHTVALYDHLKNDLKPQGEEFLASDESDDWVVVDLGDILIHIMTVEYRQKYSLESFLSEL